METDLHKALKVRYAVDEESTEVMVGKYRIDAIDETGRLVEIQHAGLGSIRGKIRDLVQEHRVHVVKPLIANKLLETWDARKRRVQSSRRSPKRATVLDIFGELIHFTSVFPHPNLTLEAVLVDVVERRAPKKNVRWRRRQYKILEQRLVSVGDSVVLGTHQDLWDLLDIASTESPFGTQELALWLDRPRWFAQQVAYVLQRCGVAEHVGKRGNSKLYRRAA